MHKFSLIAGIFALGLFGYAQSQSWSLFDNVANPGGKPSTSGSRTYHK